MQHAVLVDPAPASSLKGPAFPFLEDTANLDPFDNELPHMWYVLELYAYPNYFLKKLLPYVEYPALLFFIVYPFY